MSEPPEEAAQPDPAVRPGRHRLARLVDGRWGRLFVLMNVLVLVLLLLVGAGTVGGWFYLRSIENQVRKVDAFGGLAETQRPLRVADKALNFLVLGRDNPEENTSRSDTIMLVHIPRSHDRAQVISIPRDTWTYIPRSADGRHGGVKNKINSAYAWGGTPLMVQTVENFTGVRVDHVVLIDFTGFGKVIDALGGVDVTVERPFTTTVLPDTTYQPGVHHMGSVVALDYARQRKQFADGDFSRMRHQQAILTAVMEKASRRGLLARPNQLNDFLHATAGAVQVDRDLPIFDTIWALRQLGTSDITMLTSPSNGTGMVGNQSAVFPDRAGTASLYRAVRTDTVEKWLAENPAR